jgi:hypothetical protein
MEPGSMHARYLPLLVLGLLPAESWSSSAVVRDRQVLETRTAVAASAGVKSTTGSSCNELHEAEVVLAEQEVHLLDQLSSPTALREEKEAWQSELDRGREFLENLDRARAALSCPRG